MPVLCWFMAWLTLWRQVHGFVAMEAFTSASEWTWRRQSIRDVSLRYGLYEVQEEVITNRGILEEKLMAGMSKPIQVDKPKGAGSAGGFGGGVSKGSSGSSLRAQAKGHAKTLRKEGVVRIDNVLSDEVASELKTYVTQLRKTAQEEVDSNKVAHKQRFADVLLRKNRCDLVLPLNDITCRGLYEALCKSPVGATLASILGKDAVLYEFSCLISNKGSDRQVVHPDTPFGDKDEPVLYTCFMALQDVSIDMGPTLWIPRTHTKAAHEAFQDEAAIDDNTDSPKDALLRSRPSVLGTLPKGSCAIFDSRLLHCGTANQSDESRALFYVSFKSPKIGYPGNPASIRPELPGRLNLLQLQKQLESFHKGKGCSELEAIADKMQ